MPYDDDDLFTSERGRGWRRAQRKMHPSRRRTSDTEITRTRGHKARHAREMDRLASLMADYDC